MSEVQRFWSHEASNIRCVREADFDRVTAERGAALERVTELEASFDELAASVGFSETRLDQTGDSPIDCANQLQQRLTAADERADVLETALKKISARCVAYIDAEREMPEPSVEVCQMIASAALKTAEPPLPEGWYGVDCEENHREPGITVRFYPAVQLGSDFDISSYGCAEGVPRPMTFISMSDHKCPNKSYAVKEITRGTKSPCGILVNGVIYYCEDCKK